MAGISGIAAAGVAAAGALPALGAMQGAEPQAAEIGAPGGQLRRNESFRIRHQAAIDEKKIPVPDHPTNGDEEVYSSKVGSYSKGLPHNSLGEVDPAAYGGLIQAVSTGRHTDFEAVVLGCSDPAHQRRLVNPMAGVAFDLEGTDSHQLAMPPAPAFASAEQAAEAAELYWMAMGRDVPFTEYDFHPITQAAARDLSDNFSDFRGPRAGGRVTTGTLFRGFTPGDPAGPYISQFLLKTVSFGAEEIVQRMQTLVPGIDYMTQLPDWLSIQNGCRPAQPDRFDPVRRHLRNGRDLGQYVHVDVLFQAYFNACLVLLGMQAPLNPGNPYNHSRTQEGFGTFGPPHLMTLVAEVATRALKAIWFQKWFVHRRLRPEAFGGAVHQVRNGAAGYPIHSDLLQRSPVLNQIRSRYGSYLLPQVYPEGSPLHPSYGAGHATVAGACVTILKALFDEGHFIPDPVVPSADGLSLVPYTGSEANSLRVGGELNKLAANIAIGRNFAGIHWRSDYTESMKIGEAIAISILRDQKPVYQEPLAGFTFTKFDGTAVSV